MTKNELIALAKETREKVEKLRNEMTHAVDEVSKVEGDGVGDLFYLPSDAPNGGTNCYSLFHRLGGALENFAHRLSEMKDLPEGTLVMCKAHESDLEGWRVQYYVGKGVTQRDPLLNAKSSDWLYVVPLEYFHPDGENWRPEEKYNWANYGKESE